MKRNNIKSGLFKKCLFFTGLLFVSFGVNSWGFYGHKLINRLAVFTLPEELLVFYKQHIDFVTEHAVDADKRRYTDTTEACKHYCDLDYYEQKVPIDTVPHNWKDAVAKYTEDTLKAYGIVPWHIGLMKWKLTEAFKENNKDAILKISADIGHYLADAHVPLHATMNYNGQLTNQKGIHGLWESRLPELFSNQYDFFVGRASYIENIQAFAWTAITGSFDAKDSVLSFEENLNQNFPADKKYTMVSKGNNMIKTYSVNYAEAYHTKLGNQVERRMRASIWAVGCIWYTAWVDAGQPDFGEKFNKPKQTEEQVKKEIAEEQNLLFNQKMIGREE